MNNAKRVTPQEVDAAVSELRRQLLGMTQQAMLSNGTWSVTTLHSFFGGSDGQFPNGGVVLDSSGNLYGTTQAGGTYGGEEGGIAFKITP